MPRKKVEYDGSTPCANERHEQYVKYRLEGLDMHEARDQAGYTGKGVNAAYKLDNRKDVKLRLDYCRGQIMDRVISHVAVSKADIQKSILETRDLAKAEQPIFDKDGNETGKFRKPDLASANRADEILCKMNGYLQVDAKNEEDEDFDGKSAEDIRGMIRALMSEVEPSLKKKMIEELNQSQPNESDIIEGEIILQ